MCDPDHSYLLSPVLAPDAILSRFPPTRMMLGGIDPVRDEGLIFAQKLMKNNVNLKVREYEFLCHGFLNMNSNTV